MGIPAAFRWLSRKYPKIISPVVEDQPVVLEDGSTIPVDTVRPNPNGEEFDNLYLDMNGIVHPCSHPEDKPAPKDEEEMMLEIFKYTDRVVNMVRPRKLLMIAIDGVAPRAKMNQQRSRRFRSAREAKEKEVDKAELLKMIKQQNGGELPAETLEAMNKKAFDSNTITPGTPFMDILAGSLRYWCAYKLNTDPGWAKMKIIISDATVPGEGEHKIMNFIRSQRASADHDPNTRHVIYGLDADLIMLGLATHEPHFRVLREDVFFQEAKTQGCKLCGQPGHEAKDCRGEASKDTRSGVVDKAGPLKPFIWLHVAILREYLAIELDVPSLPFRFDLERAVDDWIFMCCFVGNDFLPHLPALEIREDGINTLMAIWRDNLPSMGGYITKDGNVDLERAQSILSGLATQEDAIFKRRRDQEERREANNKRRKTQNERTPRGGNKAVDELPSVPPNAITHDMIINRPAEDASSANKSAAAVLKSQMQVLTGKGRKKNKSKAPASALGKRKASMLEDDAPSTPGSAAGGESKPGTPQAKQDPAEDTVMLWKDGYADRYYEQKFHVDHKDIDFRRKVAYAYVEGLCWVLQYYFQGCPSWEWYYPYHYAPFAKDFVDIAKVEVNFEKGRTSRPFEQLLSVQPAASKHVLPEVFHDLMTDPGSEIIDFYPEDFEIDLNGKKMAWQGVALLPFIEMPRLLAAAESRYPLLNEADAARNGVGKEVLLLSEDNQELYDDIIGKFYSKKQGEPNFKLNPRLSQGLTGKVSKMPDYLPHGTLDYPLERKAMPGVEDDRSVTVHYEMPNSSRRHKSMILRGAQLPKPALSRSDMEMLRGKLRFEGRSHGGVPLTSDRGGRINYGPGSGGRGGGRHNGDNAYASPSPGGWVPPPPGFAGFGAGYGAGFGAGLPPPPPVRFNNGGRDPYGGGFAGPNFGGNMGAGQTRGPGNGGTQGYYAAQAPGVPPGFGGPRGQYSHPPPASASNGNGNGNRVQDRRAQGGGRGSRGGRDRR